MKATPPKPSVVIADDHRMVAAGMRYLLADDFRVLACVDSGRALLDAVEQMRPQVVLVDISMPSLNGIEAARLLKRIAPEIKVIFVTMHTDHSYVQEALKAGGHGYVLKQSSASELSVAITEVLAGRIYLSPKVASRAKLRLPMTAIEPDTPPTELTLRQLEVLQLVAKGNSGKEIAHLLNISVKTVEFHKTKITRKLNLYSTAELTHYAIDRGLLS